MSSVNIYSTVIINPFLMLIVDEHERSLQKAKEEHLKQLEEVKKAKETSGFVLLLSFLIFSSKVK